MYLYPQWWRGFQSGLRKRRTERYVGMEWGDWVYSTDCENGFYITVLVNYPWPSISVPTSEFSLCLSSSGGPSPSLEPVVTDAVSTSLNPPAVRYHSDHDSDVIPVLVGLAQPQTSRWQRTGKTLTSCSASRTYLYYSYPEESSEIIL